MKVNGKKSYLIGRTFGRLTVIGEAVQEEIKAKQAGKKSHANTIWTCKCDCGRYVFIAACRLLSGDANQCGIHPNGASMRNRKRPTPIKEKARSTIEQFLYNYRPGGAHA